MKSAPWILLLMAAPASAGDGMFSAWRRGCDEPRGPVGHWPEVRRAREIERLCPAQQFAIYERDKMALEAASPSLFRPRNAYAAVNTAPAPAPPPPTVPSTNAPR